MLKYIRKRNGDVVDFNSDKIKQAIRKAGEATDAGLSTEELNQLTAMVVTMAPQDSVPTVEQIQDVVENVLIKEGFAKTAKAYILYRAEHSMIRQSEADLMDIYKELTFASAKDADIKRENANIDGDTAMGTMLKYGSEGSKYFIDNYILPKDIAAAHINGDIHIHDKDFYMLTETCCQIDLLKLFRDGFSTGHGYLREPNSITSYSALACIAIQANQNEMHGGQSVPNFDYSMAPGVAKTYAKEYVKALTRYLQATQNLSADKAKEIAGDVSRRAGTPKLGHGNASRRDLTSHGNASRGDLTSEDNAQQTLDSYGEAILPLLMETFSGMDREQARQAHVMATEVAYSETDRATFQAMEALVHNLNTMNSRAGAQVPFSSLNYGTDTSDEGRMVIRNLLAATDSGLGNGETPIFPVQIFKVKEGVNYKAGDPNYDLFQQAIRTSAKRLFPNFSFLDAPFNLQYYRPGDYNSEVSYMGCRTRVMGNRYDPSREVTCGRGNLSFTSINLPRIGMEAKGDIDAFYRLLDRQMDLVIRQLMHRYKIQAAKKCLNYPFLMGQGIWIQSDELGPDDTIGEVLKHGTLSVGFIGLAETLVALTGKHHGESQESQELGLQIISYMRKRMDQESEKTSMNFTLLATPAEGLSGRFVRIDKKIYGERAGITDRDYYTNSFHIPVYYPISAYKKIQLEAPYHAFTNAGHISYVELDGDTCKNPQAFEAVIRCMKEAGIGYGSVNHPVDRDPVCGYTGVIDDVCPRCGRRDGEGISLEKLNELRKKYPNMPHFCGCE